MHSLRPDLSVDGDAGFVGFDTSRRSRSLVLIMFTTLLRFVRAFFAIPKGMMNVYVTSLPAAHQWPLVGEMVMMLCNSS